MKILIAPDSFKGCLTSKEVATTISEVLKGLLPDADIITVPVADGGEGTVESLAAALHGEIVTAAVSDPLGRLIEASYCIVGDTAIIETASACGLALLKPEERNPLKTSSRGLGELILNALERGCQSFMIGLGGSATNDGGRGMVEIPGFIDKAQGHKFTVACDVTTTFRDATRIFSPQKGARAEDLPILEKRLSEYADIILQKTGIDVNELPGSGAAGGLGGAFAAWLGADLVPGIEMVLEAVGFDKMLEGVDLIITGEGRSDYQTVKGKTPWGILKHASAKKIPTVLMSGIIEVCPEFERFVKCIQITPANQTLSEAIQPENARRNIIQALSQNREWFE